MTEVEPGVVIVDKPAGITSHDVVARVRRLAGTRKVGHAGTLDPMATGVLVVGIGRATRLLGHLRMTDKAYDATIRLGVTTSTDDAEGEVLATRAGGRPRRRRDPGRARGFAGEIDQVRRRSAPSRSPDVAPTSWCAPARRWSSTPRRVAHRRDRRAGIDHAEHANVTDVTVGVRCSTGTYIRSLARDLGETLGVGGHLTALRRTAVGAFGLDAAHTLERAGRAVRDAAHATRWRGRRSRRTTSTSSRPTASATAASSTLDLGRAGPVAVFAPGGEFLALYEQNGDLACAVAVFTG